MVNSKENDKFDLGVRELRGWGVKGSAANNTMSSHLEMVNETPAKELKKERVQGLELFTFFLVFVFFCLVFFFILTLK